MADKQIHELTLVNRSGLNPGTSFAIVKDTNRSTADQDVRVPIEDFEGLKNNLAATTAPGVSNDGTQGYAVGSKWIDVLNNTAYFCLDASTGAALWQEVGAGGGGGAFNPVEAEMLMRRTASAAAAGGSAGPAIIDPDTFISAHMVEKETVEFSGVADVDIAFDGTKKTTIILFDFTVETVPSNGFLEARSGGSHYSAYTFYGSWISSNYWNSSTGSGQVSFPYVGYVGNHYRGWVMFRGGSNRWLTAGGHYLANSYGGLMSFGMQCNTSVDGIGFDFASGAITGKYRHYESNL